MFNWREYVFAYRDLERLRHQYTMLYCEYLQDKSKADDSIKILMRQLAEERHLQGLLVECVNGLRGELKRYRGW